MDRVGDNLVVEHGPDEVVCGACLKPYLPPNGVVHIFRQNWDDPGSPMCPDCLGRLVTRDIIKEDDRVFLCRCGSLDPEWADKPCPVHAQAPPEPKVH